MRNIRHLCLLICIITSLQIHALDKPQITLEGNVIDYDHVSKNILASGNIILIYKNYTIHAENLDYRMLEKKIQFPGTSTVTAVSPNTRGGVTYRISASNPADPAILGGCPFIIDPVTGVITVNPSNPGAILLFNRGLTYPSPYTVNMTVIATDNSVPPFNITGFAAVTITAIRPRVTPLRVTLPGGQPAGSYKESATSGGKTSCEFAEAVRIAYGNSGATGASSTVSASAPGRPRSSASNSATTTATPCSVRPMPPATRNNSEPFPEWCWLIRRTANVPARRTPLSPPPGPNWSFRSPTPITITSGTSTPCVSSAKANAMPSRST